MPNPPKTPHIERNSHYCLDFSQQQIHALQLNAAGEILRSASADIPPIPETIDNAYTAALAKAVKRAKRQAQMPRSIGMPCVLVTGGPEVVIRRFTWPEMPPSALHTNAVNEIIPFLPGQAEDYLISQQVIQTRAQSQADESIAVLDVWVAAIPSAISKAMTEAARQAGFLPTRLDVHQHAQEKILRLTDYARASFALLDVQGEDLNISLFLNGVFYSSRYFFNQDMSAVAEEIGSIIDYIQYRERGSGSQIDCILLYGGRENAPALYENLTEALDIPLYGVNEWFSDKIPYEYLDAYGAALTAAAMDEHLPDRFRQELDVKPVKKTSISSRTLITAAGGLAALLLLLYLGVMLPYGQLVSLQREERRLNRELALYPYTVVDLELLNQEINEMNGQIDQLDAFRRLLPSASAVLPFVYSIENDRQTVTHVSAEEGIVSISGMTADFNQMAGALTALRQNGLFASLKANIANSFAYEDFSGRTEDSTMFNLTGELQRGVISP